MEFKARHTSAASGNVCPVDDAAEPFVVGVVVALDDVPADHAALFLVGGVVGAVEREVAQRGELGLDPVQPRRVERHVGELDVVRLRPLPDDLSELPSLPADVREWLVPCQATFARLTSSRSVRLWALRFRQLM